MATLGAALMAVAVAVALAGGSPPVPPPPVLPSAGRGRAGQPLRRRVVMLSGGSAIRGPYQRRAAVAVPGRGSDGATASGAGSRTLPYGRRRGAGGCGACWGGGFTPGSTKRPGRGGGRRGHSLGIFWDSTNTPLSDRVMRLYHA
ncbi:hypothetical protein Sliba_65200 [Streptomyces nigrescens]|uniref:Uncharacterized protein n=1 Tax=Streptomyces nigrescens TaxID=1920 RepID=A0A640TR30_STRNI|nr:hypothetical protein Sliba_65200 [Streptomyces libani subsp. libani]GGW05416.1 hypothetical protein GCM10010500_69590 [Streptomyces libani subsp. libani]